MSNPTGGEASGDAAGASDCDFEIDAETKALAAKIMAKALAEVPLDSSSASASTTKAKADTELLSRCATDAVHPRFIDLKIETPTAASGAPETPRLENGGLRLAVVQMKTGMDKMANITKALEYICKARAEGAHMVVLPECFNSPYGNHYFRTYAESLDCSPTLHCIRCAALQNNMCVVAGSIPEVCQGNLYNTCTVWDNVGCLIAIHRKMHLFDIDIPNEIRFKESDTMCPGSQITFFDYCGVRIGIGICYDIRFYEMAHLMAQCGCQILIYPAAFNMTTGPKHWELLARARANDLQLYVVMASPARNEKADYVAWGHSMVVDPWGKVMKQLREKPDMLIADIDPSMVCEVRKRIPIREQRRTDIYDTVYKGPPC